MNELQQSRAKLEKQNQELLTEWHGHWRALDHEPLSAKEMIGWRQQRQDLLNQIGSLRERERSAGLLIKEIEEKRMLLSDALLRSGLCRFFC
jgi:hypothetical protein